MCPRVRSIRDALNQKRHELEGTGRYGHESQRGQLARTDRFCDLRRAAAGRPRGRTCETGAQRACGAQRSRSRAYHIRRPARPPCRPGRGAVAGRDSGALALASRGGMDRGLSGDRHRADPGRQGPAQDRTAAADRRKLEGEQGMGASAREIERQIGETRERMDANLTRLEGQTKSRAMRYGRYAAVGVAAALVAGVAFLVYRRTHRPSLADRVVSRARGVKDFKLKDLNLKERLPSVTLRV